MKTIESTEVTETTGAARTNTQTTKTIEKHFCYEKKHFHWTGILFILGGFIALGYATGEIISWYLRPLRCRACEDISCSTFWAGLGIGLLVAGFFLLHIYKRHDEHYLNNL
jgi:hypothetical protein